MVLHKLDCSKDFFDSGLARGNCLSLLSHRSDEMDFKYAQITKAELDLGRLVKKSLLGRTEELALSTA